MTTKKTIKSIAGLCIALAMLMSFGRAEAGLFNNLPQVILLQPGKEVTRQFYLNDEFQLEGFHNYASFLWVAIPDTSTDPATDPGVLTITLSTPASSTPNFGTYISYSLLGGYYAAGAAIGPNLIYSSTFTTPQKAAKAITLNAQYGIRYTTARITEIEGVVVQPTPMTIVFSLAAKKSS